MKVLVIEDDKKISSFLQNGFQEAGFVVDVAQDGLTGLDLTAAGWPNATPAVIETSEATTISMPRLRVGRFIVNNLVMKSCL